MSKNRHILNLSKHTIQRLTKKKRGGLQNQVMDYQSENPHLPEESTTCGLIHTRRSVALVFPTLPRGTAIVSCVYFFITLRRKVLVNMFGNHRIEACALCWNAIMI